MKHQTKLLRSATTRLHRTRYQPCAVCKKHRHVTELAHLVPLEEIAAACEEHDLSQLDLLEMGVPLDCVFLCPTHHVIYDQMHKGRHFPLMDCGKEEIAEFKRILEIETELRDKFGLMIADLIKKKREADNAPR